MLAAICGPIVVGSILIGADALMGEMVKSRIPHMPRKAWDRTPRSALSAAESSLAEASATVIELRRPD